MDTPKFDFTRWSWRDAKQFQRVVRQWQLAEAGGDFDEMDAAFTAVEIEISKVLVSVPDSWTVADAPDEIDWRETGAFDEYLRGDKMLPLINAMATANQETEKNSQTR